MIFRRAICKGFWVSVSQLLLKFGLASIAASSSLVPPGLALESNLQLAIRGCKVISTIAWMCDVGRAIRPEEWSRFGAELNQSELLHEDPEGLYGSKAIRLRDRKHERRWEMVPRDGHYTYDNVRLGRKSRLTLDKEYGQFFSDTPCARRATRVLKRLFPDIAGCDVTDLVVRQGQKGSYSTDATGWDLFEDVLLQLKAWPDLPPNSTLQALLRDVEARETHSARSFRTSLEAARDLVRIVIEVKRRGAGDREYIRSVLHHIGDFNEDWCKMDLELSGNTLGNRRHRNRVVRSGAVASAFRDSALRVLSAIQEETPLGQVQEEDYAKSHGKLRQLQLILFHSFFHDDEEVFRRCIRVAKSSIPHFRFKDTDSELRFFRTYEGVGKGTIQKAQNMASCSDPDPVVAMQLLLMKAIEDRQQQDSTDVTLFIRHDAHSMARKIWRRLNLGTTLDPEDGIREGSRPLALDVLGDYLTLVWMWDVQYDEDEQLKALMIELRRAYPQEARHGAPFLAVVMHGKAADAARDLRDSYEHADERHGHDMSADARLYSLKGQLSASECRDADAVKGCRFDGEEPVPCTMLTKWRELLGLVKLHAQGTLTSTEMRKYVHDLLQSGWALQSLDAWMFDERCRGLLRSLS
ncbi:unnamed protein product [Symbiodinium sp. CCMP2592]|nr:unnamed protein product [Symbiodinium sp. CCMP2592]